MVEDEACAICFLTPHTSISNSTVFPLLIQLLLPCDLLDLPGIHQAYADSALNILTAKLETAQVLSVVSISTRGVDNLSK